MPIVNEGNPYEEETHNSPAVPAGSEEPTRTSGQPAPAPAYWAHRGSAHTRGGASSSNPRRTSTNWLIPALIVACALAVLGIVLLLALRGTGSSPKATSPGSSPGTVSSSTPSVQSSSSGHSGNSGSSSATSTPAEPTASFPPGAWSTCGGGTGHETEAVEPLAAGVRVSATDGHAPSCTFVNNVVSYVQGEVKKNPGTTHFHRTDHSVRQPSKTYNEQCTRAQHLTTCDVGGTYDYMVYVRD